MTTDRTGIERLRPFAPGITLALLAVLFGFGLGGVFGAAEDSIKGRLKSSAVEVMESVYGGDLAAKDAVVQKSWTYMKRAHLHGGAIGTAALSAILLLALVGGHGRVERYSAVAFGAGALLYGLFWMLAAFKAPGMGSTGAAKESLRYISIPGAGLAILGLVGTLFSFLKALLGSRPER